MNVGIVTFPGTWSDTDCYHSINDVLGINSQYIWHKETNLSPFDCIVLPGGFSYGDYLRPGAIARFSPVMKSLPDFVTRGGLVIGICNGFQILCESGLLPGVLTQNVHLQYRCEWVNLRVENESTPFTGSLNKNQVIKIPISHGEGNYFADKTTLSQLNNSGQVLFRYCSPDGTVDQESNPNGSMSNIAGICNEKGNVLGMMPHPERCCENDIGGIDGSLIFKSIASYIGDTLDK